MKLRSLAFTGICILSTLLTGCENTPTTGDQSHQTPLTEKAINYPSAFKGLGEDGSKLWLRFPPIPQSHRLDSYKTALSHIVVFSSSQTADIIESELTKGINGLTGMDVKTTQNISTGSVVIGTPDTSEIAVLPLQTDTSTLGEDGFTIESVNINGKSIIAVVGNTDVATLYGTYALLRHLQSHKALSNLHLTSTPKINHRVLNHWDNLDRSVERGYSGQSLWDWEALPKQLSSRYIDYARANASIGINATVLTNVNADAKVLTPTYLVKVKALADVFRPYGIKVYLTARFSAPKEIGGLSTADPLNKDVKQWWQDKTNEIYKLIPDFGGFLVKANSEGQPGPQDYNRTHADGANMMADVIKPHGGIIMWRAFVYPSSASLDRIRQAYDEFKPLDGKFRDNVFIQPKNGALDFQPREPFHPMFGAMPQTPLALELQITKEYLGQDTHLAYLGTLYEEALQADTYANGKGSTVARVIDGSIHNYPSTAIAGVANIGSDTNWTGSQFNQANWYVYGRMAWNPDISAKEVAEEWARQTLSNDPEVVAPVVDIMMMSREALVNYMTPLGLVHIMANSHHYGPGVWSNTLSRPEWNPTYYHKANKEGIGFDRTTSGSNAVNQYFEPIQSIYNNRDSVPNELLLFFHKAKWDDKLNTGRTVWEELVHRYSQGVDEVNTMRNLWAKVENKVDSMRFKEISHHLKIQHYEARWWRDASLAYFASMAQKELPKGYSPLAHSLDYYKHLDCPTNRDKPRCEQIYKGAPSPAVLTLP